MRVMGVWGPKIEGFLAYEQQEAIDQPAPDPCSVPATITDHNLKKLHFLKLISNISWIEQM